MTVSQTPLLSHDLGSCEAASCSSRDKVGLWADAVGHGSRVLLSLSHQGHSLPWPPRGRWPWPPGCSGVCRVPPWPRVCAGLSLGRGCVLGSHLAAGVCWVPPWPRVGAGLSLGRGCVLGSPREAVLRPSLTALGKTVPVRSPCVRGAGCTLCTQGRGVCELLGVSLQGCLSRLPHLLIY